MVHASYILENDFNLRDLEDYLRWEVDLTVTEVLECDYERENLGREERKRIDQAKDFAEERIQEANEYGAKKRHALYEGAYLPRQPDLEDDLDYIDEKDLV